MTNREKKEYLSLYRELGASVERKYEELERLRSLAARVTSTLSHLPKGDGARDRMADTVGRIAGMEEELNAAIRDYVGRRGEIARAMDTVADMTLRTLLEYRYLDGKTWEEIASRMNFNCRWVLRLHDRALEQLAIESHLKNAV